VTDAAALRGRVIIDLERELAAHVAGGRMATPLLPLVVGAAQQPWTPPSAQSRICGQQRAAGDGGDHLYQPRPAALDEVAGRCVRQVPPGSGRVVTDDG